MGRKRQYRNNASKQRAYRKRKKRAQRLAAREKAVVAVTVAGEYRILYADPPWDYGNPTCRIPFAAENHYRTMALADICAMELPRIAENAVLFLWSPAPMLEKALRVIAAWRFCYKTNFVWNKLAHNVGNWSSVRHELLLVATRGSCHPDIPELVGSVVSIRRTKHSEKPEKFRELIDRLYPFGNRIELFARGRLPEHWVGWGNEYEDGRPKKPNWAPIQFSEYRQVTA